MSVADAVLDIIPDSVLQFNLSSQEATPNCTLELRHTDNKAPPIAFKVKTTQPRRYLVRPNQGLIAPGEEQKVQILLVEKDKNSLLQSYQRLGQSALDHSVDKFLVQSVAVIDETLVHELKDFDQLTALWSSVGSNSSDKRTSSAAIKKLHVRHVAQAETMTSSTTTTTPTTTTTREPIDNLSVVELRSELTTLRRKSLQSSSRLRGPNLFTMTEEEMETAAREESSLSSLEVRLNALECKLGLPEDTQVGAEGCSFEKRMQALEERCEQLTSPELRELWKESDQLMNELDPGTALTHSQQVVAPILYRKQDILASASDLSESLQLLSQIAQYLLMNPSSQPELGAPSKVDPAKVNWTEELVTQAPLLVATPSLPEQDQKRLIALEEMLRDIRNRTDQVAVRLDHLLDQYQNLVVAVSEKIVLAEETVRTKE